MSTKNYMFKSDLVNLIQEQTGLSENFSILEANRILKEQSFAEKSLASRIYDFAGSSIYSGLVQNFAEEILEYLGIPRDKLLGRVIANFIENLTFEQIRGYTSGWEDGGCEAFMKSLVDVVFESFGEYIIDRVIKGISSGSTRKEIGIPEKGPVGGLISAVEIDENIENIKKVVGAIIREKLFDVIFTQERRQEFVEFLCDRISELEFNLDSIASMVGFGDDDEE